MRKRRADPVLLFGPYEAPALCVGERATCLYRDCDVVITGWSAGLIPWPRCRGLGTRGGGNRRGAGQLPPTLWTSTETIAAGRWSHTDAAECLIPATLGLDGGIWFPIGSGVRGLVVSDERGGRRVYVVVEPASGYFGVMCKSGWMPCVRERMEWHH